jgi:transcriptional regulator with XRE-family HTH domain
MDLGKIFIRNLKKYRRLRGFSQENLAGRCKASHSYIRQLESGNKYPSFVFIGRLADALDISPSCLFVDETAPEKDEWVKRKEIETELLKTITVNVHSAIAKL